MRTAGAGGKDLNRIIKQDKIVSDSDKKFPGSYRLNVKVLAKKSNKWALAEIYDVKFNEKFFKPIRMQDCDEDEEESKEQKPKLYIEVYLEKLVASDIINGVDADEIIASLQKIRKGKLAEKETLSQDSSDEKQ